MKLTAKVKLQPSPDQAAALLRTLERANEAADWISGRAWETKTFAQYSLHKLVYRECRQRFGLSAQTTVRMIGKVADAYKRDRQTKRTFRRQGAIAYDARILRWSLEKQTVSIWSIEGRLKVGFVCGLPQQGLLRTQRGESDLICGRGVFYLAAACEIPEPEPGSVNGYLGVDLGVVNIASDCDGRRYSGSATGSVRCRQRRLRNKLQKKQTRAAKRRLKKLAGKERRFARWVNHNVSKQIVACAEDTGRGIALEQLKGIRERVTVRRKQRAVLHSWAFSQLRMFVAYKAQREGIPLVLVDPKNTSRECAICGHIDKRNRPSQSEFRCVRCGHTAHADTNAARVIAGRAAVNPPRASARLSDVCVSLHASAKSL